MKLVEENVYAKPMDGPSSNGHREDKDEKKLEEEKEAETSSKGNLMSLLCYFNWHIINLYNFPVVNFAFKFEERINLSVSHDFFS